MLEPSRSLAFELVAGKGVFALLLGSGISRSAKIPTGWDITLDLVRKVAALHAEPCEPDPATWYATRFGKAPDYSDLLDVLASTPTLRQQVIRPYIEPSEGERGRGEKLPTTAHRAIARLMAAGYIRVVLTTNFDQLLEQALADHGVRAAVISSDDHVAGALPLVHAGPVIVKLHGDYLDTRIRNTAGELASYSPAMERLLDRVLDEFGLVVCGWSADWDVALKAAIDRSPSRRFPMYWAARGEPSESAKALIDRRGARVIPIEGADVFFDEVAQAVAAVEKLNAPHPLSAEIAVAMLKDYLPESRHQIRLADLLNAELRRVLPQLDGSEFDTSTWSNEIFARQVEQYGAAMGTLVRMAYTAGLWSSEGQTGWWVDAVRTLAAREQTVSGSTHLVNLRGYPATLVLYAFGLGAVIAGRHAQLGMLVGTVADFGNLSRELALGDRLNIASLLAHGLDVFKAIPAYEQKKLPGSELMADVLRPISNGELHSADRFKEAFARLELALTFGYAERLSGESGDRFWAPPGLYVFDRHLTARLLSAWSDEYAYLDGITEGHTADLCVMAALSKPPRFDDVERFSQRFGF